MRNVLTGKPRKAPSRAGNQKRGITISNASRAAAGSRRWPNRHPPLFRQGLLTISAEERVTLMTTTTTKPKSKTDAEWKDQLTPEQYRVTASCGTERASPAPIGTSSKGLCGCVCCDAPLFRSDTKFDAGCGWPNYYEAVSPDSVREIKDTSFGMVRTKSAAEPRRHLSHVFPTAATGLRYHQRPFDGVRAGK